MSNEFASAGLTAGQLNAGVKIIGGHDAFLALLRGELVVTKVAAVVAQATAQTITVLGGVSLVDRIAAGGYDGYRGPSITEENFPHNPATVGKWECKEFYFGREVLTEVAEVFIGAAGYALAELEHLLAFGERYPDVQCSYPVVALGSSCILKGDHQFVPILDMDTHRSIWLGDRNNGTWVPQPLCENYRFLGVRRVVSVI